jgi:hypothetical protein
MKSASRISVEQLATAISKVRSMDLAAKRVLTQEIFATQPNLLASCVVQQRFGVAEHAVEFLLSILLVCFQAMKESGEDWPLIREEEQERQLARLHDTIAFYYDLTEPALANAARAQYVMNHPEAPLFAYVLRESTLWLKELAERGKENESDKFVMMAAINLVNCIAHAHGQEHI